MDIHKINLYSTKILLSITIGLMLWGLFTVLELPFALLVAITIAFLYLIKKHNPVIITTCLLLSVLLTSYIVATSLSGDAGLAAPIVFMLSVPAVVATGMLYLGFLKEIPFTETKANAIIGVASIITVVTIYLNYPTGTIREYLPIAAMVIATIALIANKEKLLDSNQPNT